MTLCAQTGCKHTDSTCQAWIGDVETYVEYYGALYASISIGDNGYQLIRKNLTNGKITVIDEWQNSKDVIPCISVKPNLEDVYLYHFGAGEDL